MSREILNNIINEFQVEKFTRFFREKNRSFAPRIEDLPQYDDDNFSNGQKLGEMQFAQDEKMFICSFEASQPLSERSSKKAQYEKGKRILRDTNADAGIFIFYSNSPLKRGVRGVSSFRFSLIYPEYTGTKRQWSYFKRFTYFVSPELTNKTFLQQIGEGDFSSLQKIKEAFSVDPVTKQFYSELQSWYFWAMDKIKFPDDYKHSDDPAKDKEIRNSTNLIRLITRIIFIWFLIEKGLIPQELFSREKLRGKVKGFMSGTGSSNYYNSILQNLFFGTLNQKMDERRFADESGYPANKKEYGVKNLFRYADKFLISKNEVLAIFKDIPFLNGGLFDCLDKEDESGRVIYIDGFSRNPAKQTNIPDNLFFQQAEERADLSGYGLGSNRTVRGLIEILQSYNFTIDENTPIDQEIALDPELLGKVFENLLASYNPETATTARKATGSYYTPREIVDYMVEESLLAYLTNSPSKNGSQEFPSERGVDAGSGRGVSDRGVGERLRQLLSYSDEMPEFSDEETQKIIAAIDKIKILDPACGSGAFPMGILHKLVYALQKLDPENKHWHELQYQKALKETEDTFKLGDKNQRQERLKEINEAFDEGINYPDYARKLYLIENCIYGVDIQPIAIQISKLRFFISLVLDQKVDKGKENLGIRALPNLETKFVAANTLIGLEMPLQLVLRNSDIERKENELKDLRHKYFTANTRKEKLQHQKQDKKLREEIAKLLINDGWKDATAKKIAAFDLYDQNASADFFDPEWMFGIKNPSCLAGAPLSNISSPLAGEGNPKTPSPLVGEGKGEGGFDVVIGNPPYVRADSPAFAEQRKLIMQSKQYETLWEKWDLMVPFYEKSLRLLNNEGINAFIASNSITTSKFAYKLQDWILKNYKVKSIDYFEDDMHIFEAGVVPVVTIIMKSKQKFNPMKIYRADEFTNIARTQEADISDSENLRERVFKKSFSNVIRPDVNTELFGNICYISYGLRPNSDERYWKGEFTRDDLISETKNEIHPKSYVEGKLIKRYAIERIMYLEWDTDRVPKKLVRPTFPELYNRPKILSGRVTGAIYDNTGLVCNDSIVVFVRFIDLAGVNNKSISGSIKKFNTLSRKELEENSKNYDLKYLLAILNSRYANFYLNNHRRHRLENYFYPDDFRNLPIPIVSPKAQQPYITLVSQILAAKQHTPLSPLDRGEFKDADTSAFERQIDEMVYKLYGLTDDEIAIVEGKIKND